jgi:hypothetical protein
MNLESRPYRYYADMVAKFDPVDTIIKFGRSQEKVKANVPTNKNVIVMYGDFDYNDGLSLLFKRTGTDSNDLKRLEYTDASSSKTNDNNNILKFIETSINKFDSLLRNGKPNDYVVIFCSDNPSDQINDPRITYDPMTKTYEFDNLSKTYEDKKYGGLNKDILMDKFVPTAPGVIHGPRLILIFKKSDPTIPPIVSSPQYVVVNKKPHDAPKPIDIKPTQPIVNCKPDIHTYTSIELYLIICVTFLVLIHIIGICVWWLRNESKA